MSNPAVDEYIDAKVSPQFRGIIAALRELFAERAPQSQEVLLYGSPAWRMSKPIAIISASRTHITLAFDRGAEFMDPHGKLAGVGRRTRHVKIKHIDEFDPDLLGGYIDQAVRLDGT